MTRTLAIAVALLLALARTAAAQAPAAAPQLVPETAPAAPPATAAPAPKMAPGEYPAAGAAPAVAPAGAAAPAAAAVAAPAAAAAAAAPAVATQPPPAKQPAAAPQAAPPPPPAAAPAQAAPPAEEKVPLRKKIFGWGSVGTTFAYGETYGSANLGLGYRMKLGITPNVEASYMFGNTPTVWALRPGVTWYSSIPVLRPYFGVYYTHWFVSGDLPDQDGVGGRLGISLGRLLSLGVTYDRALSCEKNCDIWTPQITAGLSL